MRIQLASKIRFAVLAVLATVIAQPALKAQGPGTVAVANIPFNFQIGSHHYTAGKYTLLVGDNDVMMLQGPSGSGMMTVRWDSARKPSATSELVFHHYDSHYFLRELRIKNSQDFVKSGECKEEKQAHTEELASNNGRASSADSVTEVALLNTPR